ncbi:MAG: alpha-glucan family phosphorylase [Acidobacteriaceae bacterium]|nr:alpha-glucan family phosphorylase [Acidobacteriaceae bacterium]
MTLPTQPKHLPFSLSERNVAYFSMEIALDKALPTYSGGLGMLAGDTLRSAADTGAPMVAVSLCHRRGYFQQHLDLDGQQTESDVVWQPENLPAAEHQITIQLQGRELTVRAWRYDVVGCTGHIIPVFLLDTDVDGNADWDRHLTDKLYGGDTYYRLCQEGILGLAGLHLLHALGMQPTVCHMNEGHASLLTIALLEDRIAGGPLHTATDADAEAVRQMCVFTTHTPVPAGHDHFSLDQAGQILGHDRLSVIDRFGALHNGMLNMTYLALRFSRYVNGVAMQHGKVSQQMFPEYNVHAITNGVHAATWLSKPFTQLFDKEIPEWRHDNEYLRSVYGIEPTVINATHEIGKQRLFDTVKQRTGLSLDPMVLTLGFARRVATYKRAHLLFQDPDRLEALAQKLGGLQVLYAGKAHPADGGGKQLIRDVFTAAKKLNNSKLTIIYLENYDWDLGEQLTGGVDIWLNTPMRPYEASGTSGMKAALNGVPSLSVLDGWWIEGCAEGVTGWAVNDATDDSNEAQNLYSKLEEAVIPLWQDKKALARLRQHCIAMNGTFFNTHRMLGQYVSNAYFPLASSVASTDQIIIDDEAHETVSA